MDAICDCRSDCFRSIKECCFGAMSVWIKKIQRNMFSLFVKFAGRSNLRREVFVLKKISLSAVILI